GAAAWAPRYVAPSMTTIVASDIDVALVRWRRTLRYTGTNDRDADIRSARNDEVDPRRRILSARPSPESPGSVCPAFRLSVPDGRSATRTRPRRGLVTSP